MAYEPSFKRSDVIDALCMEIAELPLASSPTVYQSHAA